MHSASVIGVDLGGTKTAVARYDSLTMKEQECVRLPTHADRHFPHVFDDLVAAINDVRAEDTTGIGIGVPGLVDRMSGAIATMPNIPGAEGFPLLLDPSIIIFGGSAGRALTNHFLEIREELKVWMPPKAPLPDLAAARLDDAATRGAALLVPPS